MSGPILQLDKLSMAFGGLKAVDELSFEVNRREIVGLIGPNGAGKTTVFNCVTQFYKGYQGRVLYHDESGPVDLKDLKVTDVVKVGIVRTFQNLELVPDLSILDNVLIGAHVHFTSGIVSQVLRTPKARREERQMTERAMEVLEFLGLSTMAHQWVAGQPYGVLKKVEIARTLMARPQLIILDEPAAGLNDGETAELEELIRAIRERYDCAILLIEHDMSLVMNLCDRVCAINFGRFLAMDKPELIQKNPAVQEAYLGKDDEP